jgi:cytochrome P450
VALLQNVDQIARLRTDPVLWPSAVQELLRYASPLHGVLRTASRDCVLGGKPIGRGERVLIGLAAGNRDPDKFIDPERLDVGRVPNPHLAFGRGIHHCPGASLAELIAEIAIRGVLERFAGLRLAEPAIRWEGNHLFRGLRELRVTF